jgi:HlyD family secretion protein
LEAVLVAPLNLQPREPVLSVVTSTTGFVVPGRKVEVSSRLSARIVELLVERGTHVEAGAPLVRLDDREYRANQERAKAALGRAEARLQELQSGPRQQEIEAAQADLDLALALEKAAQRRVGRIQPLVEDRVENEQSLDYARTDLEVAQARSHASRKRFELLKLGTRPETIRAVEADVAEARANLASADSLLSETVLRAPIAGIVLERFSEAGEVVPKTAYDKAPFPVSHLLTIADLRSMEVELDVNQSEIAGIALDQACTVTLDAAPGREYTGRVVQISPNANRQKSSVQTRVRLLDADEKVKPELTARVTIYSVRLPAGTEPPRLFAPPTAVVVRNGTPAVLVADGEQARIRSVKTGQHTPQGVEIVAGLAGQELVLVAPTDGLQEGSAIRPERR